MNPETAYAIMAFPVSAAAAIIGASYFSWRKRVSDNETYAERAKADIERKRAEEDLNLKILADPNYQKFLEERRRMHDALCERYGVDRDFSGYYGHRDFIAEIVNLVLPPPHLLMEKPKK
jgi:hypothetical protein